MDYKIQFEFGDATGWSQEFTSARNLLKFLQQEYKFWGEFNIERYDSGDKQYLNFYNNLSEPINILEGMLNTKDLLETEIKEKLQRIKQYFNRAGSQWLYSKQAITKHYLAIIKKENLNVANAFLEYSLKKSLTSISNHDCFKGYLKAYEFQYSDSNLIKRRDSEKKSLSKIREHFQNSQDELFVEVEALKNDFNIWEENTKNASKKLYRVQQKLGERKLKQQNNVFDTNLSNWNTKVSELETAYQAKIEELEAVYKEKLKLEGPATYWNKAAVRYEKHGTNWARALVLFTILGIFVFAILLTLWFSGKSMPLQITSVQGVLMFASLVAMFAYLMRVLSRMTFSSFHLMRDAQEREQLTYLYLSLTHDSEIDKSSRDIVLQSLFSRSETGLLAKENGPTMPTISEVLSRAGKS